MMVGLKQPQFASLLFLQLEICGLVNHLTQSTDSSWLIRKLIENEDRIRKEWTKKAANMYTRSVFVDNLSYSYQKLITLCNPRCIVDVGTKREPAREFVANVFGKRK